MEEQLASGTICRSCGNSGTDITGKPCVCKLSPAWQDEVGNLRRNNAYWQSRAINLQAGHGLDLLAKEAIVLRSLDSHSMEFRLAMQEIVLAASKAGFALMREKVEGKPSC